MKHCCSQSAAAGAFGQRRASLKFLATWFVVAQGLLSSTAFLEAAAAPAMLTLETAATQADGRTAASIRIAGTSGVSYRVDQADGIPPAQWKVLTNIALTGSSIVLADISSEVTGQRFYRAVAQESAGSITAAAVAAANSFLDSLTTAQRATVQFTFSNATQRQKWSNLPKPLFNRAGLRLGDITAAQRDGVMKLLAAILSTQGYAKITNIFEGDEVLKSTSGGGNLVFGRDEYYISLLGTPTLDHPWMVQFGGHHLALNATLAGTNGTLAPTLTAAQPATYTLNGKTVRPLGAEYDKALALMATLSTDQRSQAIIGSTFRDLVLGPGKDGVTIVPEGIKGSLLTSSQRSLLLDIAKEWVGISSDDITAAKMAELEANLDSTWFAWSGPTTSGSAFYYRIQGPTVVIEFSPQNLGGSAVNHIHTIYRDPTNDYGVKWWSL